MASTSGTTFPQTARCDQHLVICSALSTLNSRSLCTLNSVLSPLCPRLCTLDTVLSSCTVLPPRPLDSVPLHSLYSRLCTLATVLSHCTDTLCTHNLCTLDFGFSQSLHSRLCTLRLHSRLCILALSVPSTLHSRVLHSNTFFILALSVLSSLHSDSALSNCALIVHCAPSRLCALALSALSTLYSHIALSTLNSRLFTLTLHADNLYRCESYSVMMPPNVGQPQYMPPQQPQQQ